MKKKIVTFLLALTMMPLGLILTACGGIEQPAQSEMFATFKKALEKAIEYRGDYTIDVSGSETESEETYSTEYTNTYNSTTGEFIYKANEVEEDGVKTKDFDYLIRSKDNNLEYFSYNSDNNRLVDQAYAQELANKKWLDSMEIAEMFESYETYDQMMEDVNDEKENILEEYTSENGYSNVNVVYDMKFVKTGDNKYSFAMTRGLKYTRTREDEVRNINQEYTYKVYFSDSFVTGINQNSDYLSKRTPTEGEETTYSGKANYNMTISKSFDSDTYTEFTTDLTLESPTAKVSQDLFIYNGSTYMPTIAEKVEFGTDIDEMINSLEAPENTTISLDYAYTDNEFTAKYVSGGKTSSTESTRLYVVPKPNAGYASVLVNYIAMGENNVVDASRFYVEESTSTFDIEKIYNYYSYSKIVVNGVEESADSLTLEDGKVYIINCYRDYLPGYVTPEIYVMGEIYSDYMSSQKAGILVDYYKDIVDIYLGNQYWADSDIFVNFVAYQDAEFTTPYEQGDIVSEDGQKIYYKIVPELEGLGEGCSASIYSVTINNTLQTIEIVDFIDDQTTCSITEYVGVCSEETHNITINGTPLAEVDGAELVDGDLTFTVNAGTTIIVDITLKANA